jgi:hypothetical protein
MKVFQGGELHVVIGCFAIGDFLTGAIELCAQSDAAVHAVDSPATRGNCGILGKGNDVQDGGANMFGPMPRKRDSW